MELIIDFPGGERVDAHLGLLSVQTDQNGSAFSPFAMFLASIGTCAGIYVLSFCKQRKLDSTGIRVIERTYTNPNTHMVEKIDLEIQVPPDFPQQYHESLVRTANLCAVKKHLETPPTFNTYTKVM
jgi:putative redox protein